VADPFDLASPTQLGLASPTHVVIGATDLDASIDWWAGLGFGVTTENTLDADVADRLFGLAGQVEQVELRVDEAPGGAIWLVQTARSHRARLPLERGPLAVGVYTTDMEASLALATDLGALPGGGIEHNFDYHGSEERSVVGPDGSTMVFIAAVDRQPSVLDIHPEWLHSEIHSIVSVVPSVDTSNRFWSEQLGLIIASDSDSDLEFARENATASHHVVRARRTSLCDEFINPIRYEFIGYSGTAHDAVGQVSTWPLPSALPLGCFAVTDVAASAAHMFRAGATFGDIVDLGDGCAIGGDRAIWGLDPNGTRFFLVGY
jgi:catechol 2,3-dioxygenase-like lactoylglutathione lyase family enzyme